MKKTKNGTRWAFIVNPVAGKGRTAKYISYLENFKDRLHPEIDLHITGKPGHATTICDDLIRKGYRRFVAVGGDGTFNEVIQSLAAHGDCTLGIFPSGSGNDYAPGAGFPDHYEPRELADLFKCAEIPVDVGVCNGRYFLNNVGFGFDAKVGTDFFNSKINLGKINYWIAVFRNIMFYRATGCTISNGGKKTTLLSLLVSIGIGRRCGGGFHLTPRAIINDSLLDICAINNRGSFGRISTLMKVSRRSHVGTEGIHYFNATKIRLSFEDTVPAHIDGEVFSGKQFDVHIIPGAVRLLVHPERENYLG